MNRLEEGNQENTAVEVLPDVGDLETIEWHQADASSSHGRSWVDCAPKIFGSINAQKGEMGWSVTF
jgi:hypothetical protein